MSDELKVTDAMLDVVLAAHRVPELDQDFASRVLAAAQSLPTGRRIGRTWPRPSRRPWPRSPLWLGVIALNIVAASAVAAMVTGIPVWHQVSEIVRKVTQRWHPEATHPAKRRVARPPTVVASQEAAPFAVAVGKGNATPNTGPSPVDGQQAIVQLPQLQNHPLATLSHDYSRLARAGLGRVVMMHRPNIPHGPRLRTVSERRTKQARQAFVDRRIDAHRTRLKKIGHDARSNMLEPTVRAARGRRAERILEPLTSLNKTPPIMTLPARSDKPSLARDRAKPQRQDRARSHFEIAREARGAPIGSRVERRPVPITTPLSRTYGPRPEEQRSLPERQDRASRRFEMAREARAERLRSHDRRPARMIHHQARRRFVF